MPLPSPSSARIPPHSLEAEQSVLGALLLDKDAILKVADILTPSAFYQDSHRVIYEAMLQLFEAREPIDVLSLSEKLKASGELDRLGGTQTLTSLVNGVPSAAHVQHYGKLVQQKATLRRLISAANEINEMSYRQTDDVESILDQSESKLFQVSQQQLKQNFVPLKSILTETFERIDELHRNRGSLRGIATGFTDLDELLAGLQKSNLVILAARPSMGKTTFALDIVRHIVTTLKQSVGFFSLEMSRDELVDRLLASQAQLDLWRLRTGRLAERPGDNDFERLNEAMAELSEAPLFIDDSAGLNIMELRTKARRLHSEHKLGLIVVDYLQLMEGRQSENRVQEVSEISRALKMIARELNVPVLALSQLSRAVESREPKIPQLSDLRESGCLTGDTLVTLADSGARVPMRDLAGKSGFKVWALNEQTLKLEAADVSRAFTTGRKKVYRLRTRLGRTVRATGNHKFRTFNGWERLDALIPGDRIATPRSFANRAHESVREHVRVAALIQSDIHWDEVASIEPDGVEDVYDLTVPGLSNFVANDVIVHNSLEQDADVVMFIYRESMYKPDSKRPNVAEIHIRKHRNGPTGTIELFFNAQQVRFQNLAKAAGNRPPVGSPPPLAPPAPPLTPIASAPSMPTT